MKSQRRREIVRIRFDDLAVRVKWDYQIDKPNALLPEDMPTAISGDRTRSIFDHYNIVKEANLEQAEKSMIVYFEQEKLTMATLKVTPAELGRESSSPGRREERWLRLVGQPRAFLKWCLAGC
ncbi:MAG: hypothetical protein ABIR36_02050 [Nitrospiraceae bacterium]